MEKKKAKQKRSDAEIIKIFKHCLSGSDNCGDCPYKQTVYRCDIQRLNAEVLNVVERLQKEKLEVQKQAVKDTVKTIADWLDNEKGYCGLGCLVKQKFLTDGQKKD
ncbi:MAG: hypothetical protein IJZ32_04485 [Clostridia bacterium]|nr:hypothetical protein [Clostridia bacterium]